MCCLCSFLKGWICQRSHFSSPVFPEQNICPVKPSRRAAESMSEQFAKAAAPPRLQLRADRWLDHVDGVHACDWWIAPLQTAAGRNMIWMRERDLNLISGATTGPELHSFISVPDRLSRGELQLFSDQRNAITSHLSPGCLYSSPKWSHIEMPTSRLRSWDVQRFHLANLQFNNPKRFFPPWLKQISVSLARNGRRRNANAWWNLPTTTVQKMLL